MTLGVSCLDPAEIALPKRPAPHVEYLSNDEIRRVLDATNVHTFAGIRLRALIELLLSTGMRISLPGQGGAITLHFRFVSIACARCSSELSGPIPAEDRP